MVHLKCMKLLNHLGVLYVIDSLSLCCKFCTIEGNLFSIWNWLLGFNMGAFMQFIPLVTMSQELHLSVGIVNRKQNRDYWLDDGASKNLTFEEDAHLSLNVTTHFMRVQFSLHEAKIASVSASLV